MAHTFRHLPTSVLSALTYNVCADSTSIELGIMAGSVRRPEQTGPPELVRGGRGRINIRMDGHLFLTRSLQQFFFFIVSTHVKICVLGYKIT